MNTSQIQIRISLTNQLYDFLLGQSSRLGLPVTQVVKHLIVERAQQEEYPIFKPSARTIRKAKQALADYKKGKTIPVEDVAEFFKNL